MLRPYNQHAQHKHACMGYHSRVQPLPQGGGRARSPGSYACCAAVRGTTIPTTCAPCIGTTTIHQIATTTTVFGWLGPPCSSAPSSGPAAGRDGALPACRAGAFQQCAMTSHRQLRRGEGRGTAPGASGLAQAARQGSTRALPASGTYRTTSPRLAQAREATPSSVALPMRIALTTLVTFAILCACLAAGALWHSVARLRRLSRPPPAEAAQRGELCAPAAPQPCPVRRRPDQLRRAGRQRAGLDRACGSRRHVGLAQAHL